MDHLTAQARKYEREEEDILARRRADNERLGEIPRLKDAYQVLMQV